MNKIILMGRLVADPETRDGETKIVKFRLAVGRRGKDEADFFTCVAFGKTAEFIEKYLRKGTKVIISGRMQNDNYTNKDGVKCYGFSVVVDEVDFCEKKAAADPFTEAGEPPFN